jgi:mannosyltransferase OCH1-like enzyme
MPIPRIIHQTYISEAKIPECWKDSPAEWKRLHPEATYMFWSDVDNRRFVAEHFPDFLDRYDSFPHNIQRADAIRYMILYVHGGVYSDLDIIPNKNVFEHLDSGDVFLMHSANVNNVFTNSFMASRPRQQFWLDAINAMKKDAPFYCIGKHLQVMNTTGPLMITSVSKTTHSNITVLPTDLFNPSDVSEISSKKTRNNGVLRSTEGNSWHSFDSTMYNFFYNYRVVFLTLLAVAAVFLIVFVIRWTYLYFWIKRNCDCVCER